MSGEAEAATATLHAMHVCERGRAVSGDSIRSIDDALLWCDSGNRLDTVLRCIARADDATFWVVFNNWFCDCDDTWPAHRRLLSMLRRRRLSGRRYLTADARAFLEALPHEVRIYRGCSLARLTGLSWTTDREVARGFAHGHRNIRVPNAVVATATIPRDHVFTVFVERQESEVLVDPAHLVIDDVALYRGHEQ